VKKLLLVTAAFVAAVAVFVRFTAPPRRLALAAPSDGTIPGIIHVHTNRSDGLSGPDEIAAAAARAGLKFLVFTDHGVEADAGQRHLILSVVSEHRCRAGVITEQTILDAARNTLFYGSTFDQPWKTEEGIETVNHVGGLDA